MLAWLTLSCKMNESEQIETLLSQWNGKEILFPDDLSFEILGEKEIDFNVPDNGYKVVHYIDSIGCTSCKLNLNEWKEYISYMDSITNHTVPCLFFIHAKQKREIKIALKENSFEYPICFDVENKFYQHNKFPMMPVLQTFLLDKDNRIVGMGNPVKNPRVRELYLNIIKGVKTKQELELSQTMVELKNNEFDFGNFPWDVQQDTIVSLTNIGSKPLVIHDISTSCGCTVVDYDRQPILPGRSIVLNVVFNAEYPGYFRKNIVVHCNTQSSPLVFWIKGTALR